MVFGCLTHFGHGIILMLDPRFLFGYSNANICHTMGTLDTIGARRQRLHCSGLFNDFGPWRLFGSLSKRSRDKRIASSTESCRVVGDFTFIGGCIPRLGILCDLIHWIRCLPACVAQKQSIRFCSLLLPVHPHSNHYFPE